MRDLSPGFCTLLPALGLFRSTASPGNTKFASFRAKSFRSAQFSEGTVCCVRARLAPAPAVLLLPSTPSCLILSTAMEAAPQICQKHLSAAGPVPHIGAGAFCEKPTHTGWQSAEMSQFLLLVFKKLSFQCQPGLQATPEPVCVNAAVCPAWMNS